MVPDPCCREFYSLGLGLLLLNPLVLHILALLDIYTIGHRTTDPFLT